MGDLMGSRVGNRLCMGKMRRLTRSAGSRYSLPVQGKLNRHR